MSVAERTERFGDQEFSLKVRNTRTSDGRAGAALIKRIVHRDREAPPPKPRAVADMSDALSPTATIMTLRRGMCRWPIGDVGTPEFGFCGRKAIIEQSYCPCHHARAYEPPIIPADVYIETVVRMARRWR